MCYYIECFPEVQKRCDLLLFLCLEKQLSSKENYQESLAHHLFGKPQWHFSIYYCVYNSSHFFPSPKYDCMHLLLLSHVLYLSLLNWLAKNLWQPICDLIQFYYQIIYWLFLKNRVNLFFFSFFCWVLGGEQDKTISTTTVKVFPSPMAQPLYIIYYFLVKEGLLKDCARLIK